MTTRIGRTNGRLHRKNGRLGAGCCCSPPADPPYITGDWYQTIGQKYVFFGTYYDPDNNVRAITLSGAVAVAGVTCNHFSPTDGGFSTSENVGSGNENGGVVFAAGAGSALTPAMFTFPTLYNLAPTVTVTSVVSVGTAVTISGTATDDLKYGHSTTAGIIVQFSGGTGGFSSGLNGNTATVLADGSWSYNFTRFFALNSGDHFTATVFDWYGLSGTTVWTQP